MEQSKLIEVCELMKIQEQIEISNETVFFFTLIYYNTVNPC